MHLLFREQHALDEAAPAVDLGQSPAPLVFLSFADSDLAAWSAAWRDISGPALRLANLARLRHPLSVDLYVDRVVSQARCVVLRLLGGAEYWRYGLQEVSAICRERGIALAVLAGDGASAALDGYGTVAPELRARLDALAREGGVENARRALRLAAHLAGFRDDDGAMPEPLAPCGEYVAAFRDGAGLAVIVFYRAHLLASDTAPILALADALAARGLAVRALYVANLKQADCAAFVCEKLRAWPTRVVLNATGFSARAGDASPLEAADTVVLQVILPGNCEIAWRQSVRGLSPADLAMQVVLPEADGRLLTTVISFKAERETVPGLEFAAVCHTPYPPGVALAADRAAGWVRLAETSCAERCIAIVLSNYGAAQQGYAVGLDSFASIDAILGLMRNAGYDVGIAPIWSEQLIPLSEYERLFATLPDTFRDLVCAAWRAPSQALRFRVALCGRAIIAVQPERGHRQDRRSGYHDPNLPPTHEYIGFHLWLREVGVHALLQLGTHGTLEWLPGKAFGLSENCAPVCLLRGLPVIYPFIVNNPGEAAVARRRLGAVTIGHLTPPLIEAGLSGEAAVLEHMLEEYAAADGLDRNRLKLLRKTILDRADATGLLAESRAVGLDEDAALAQLDTYLCDVKTLSIRDGLHVFGCRPTQPEKLLLGLQKTCPDADPARLLAALNACAGAEQGALLAALAGRFVQPGPAGAPSRGRADVLPTGRNLSTIDIRTIPTPTALRLAERSAEEILRKHQQDYGDWPRSLVLNLWGSATLRTGGEDFALALVLLGVRPQWDSVSGRVIGTEIVPLAELDRPRIDVTLRISGLFRDAFADQVALFDQAVQALARRDEAADWNALATARDLSDAAFRQATRRVFGPAPGQYGTGVEGASTRAEMAETYLAASSYAYAPGEEGVLAPAAFTKLAAAAEAFVHLQDHRETDILDGLDHAAHQAGFAALGQAAPHAIPMYHTDISDPSAPRARTVAEEVVRVVRGRAANPVWIAAMRRHGRSGAAEIARPVHALFRFALGMATRFDRSFDLLHEATLADPDVAQFLRRNNPEALEAMIDCFRMAQSQGLWHPRRNTQDEAA